MVRDHMLNCTFRLCICRSMHNLYCNSTEKFLEIKEDTILEEELIFIKYFAIALLDEGIRKFPRSDILKLHKAHIQITELEFIHPGYNTLYSIPKVRNSKGKIFSLQQFLIWKRI